MSFTLNSIMISAHGSHGRDAPAGCVVLKDLQVAEPAPGIFRTNQARRSRSLSCAHAAKFVRSKFGGATITIAKRDESQMISGLCKQRERSAAE